ncbi:MAG: hypothetical protein LH606_22390 [Cytophagaceae bacterium]|nr:hypothetical protein [Cytophagaceae bacterium]
MKRKLAFPLILVGLIALITVNCTKKEEIKFFEQFLGRYAGLATNSANSADKKTMSLTITSNDNPVAGTYSLSGGGVSAQGKVTGTVLGLILNMTFKPDATGTTYTFSGNSQDNNKITGTMTGVEAGKTVKYDVDLKK